MNIQTHANKITGNPKKGEIAELLERIYNTIPDSYEDLKIDLAYAYKAYMPKASKKPKTPLEWVALACGKEAARPYTHHVYSTGDGVVVATDGHRLHLAKALFPKGFYDAAGNRIGIDFTFPDYTRVITEKYEQEIDILNCEVGVAGEIKYFIASKYGFNLKYVKDAMSYGVGVFTHDNRPGPARIDFEDGRITVIMPMKIH